MLEYNRILIIEDERAVARGLEVGLRQEGFAVHWAETGRRALELMAPFDPSLILLDLRLPDMSGFDLCRHLRANGSRQPILMLTARDDEVDKVLGLELGADDYVVKPYSLRELASRIRALLRRAYGELSAPTGGSERATTLRFGPFVLDQERLALRRDDERCELTPLEFRLLYHLVSNPDRPFSRSQLIQAVWGYDSEIDSERTVDVHIRHLRQKLEDDPANPRWLLTARGAGYKFQP